MNKKIIRCAAPFDLRNQNSFFGGWPVLRDTEDEFSIAVTFPVEDWEESATVVVSQSKNGGLSAEVYGIQKNSEQAMQQALATLSLDVDDKAWQSIAKQDEVISSLQEKYGYLRPVLFHSPYEAAAGFVIGQRISIRQRQTIQKKMSEQLGEKFNVEGQSFSAFPLPQSILGLNEFPSLNATKLERLHGIARAALDGKLSREHLLSLNPEQALSELQKLDGVGPFYASGILYRGAGVVNDITDDSMTKYAVQQAYNLPNEPTQAEVISIAENWRPYRMWCEVLIHVWLRREVGLPKRG